MHAADAAAHGATEINIHSPDTDGLYSVFEKISSALS